MTYTNCRRYRINICYVPPYAVGKNSFWKPQADGSVVIWYKYTSIVRFAAVRGISHNSTDVMDGWQYVRHPRERGPKG